MIGIYRAEWLWWKNCYRIFPENYPAKTICYFFNRKQLKNLNFGIVETINYPKDHSKFILCKLEG